MHKRTMRYPFVTYLGSLYTLHLHACMPDYDWHTALASINFQCITDNRKNHLTNESTQG